MEESTSTRRPQGKQNAEVYGAETPTMMFHNVLSATMPLFQAQPHHQTSFAEGIH